MTLHDLAIQKPGKALELLRTVIIPENTTPEDMIQVTIRIKEDNVSVRDMSAFLELIDHIYGRLTQVGFQTYARRTYGYLSFSKIRKGSWELVLETVLRHLKQSEILIVIWLAIKYLPHVLQAGATAYNQYEQARLARENRKRIRQEMEEEEELRSLPTHRRKQLATLLEILFSRETDKLPRAKRFAKRSIKDVQIEIQRKKEIKKPNI